MMHKPKTQMSMAHSARGFTLAEVLIAMAILGLTVGGILYGYCMTTKRAELSAYNLAAQALAIQRLEQVRSAQWQPNNYPVVDDLQSSNFLDEVQVLDVPIQGTNILYATNITTITTISDSPPLRMVRVDCVWSFPGKGVFTNTIANYRSP